jgi:ketosteroid isomerase-like protein
LYVDGQGELQSKAQYVAGIGDKSYRPEEIRNEDLKVVMYGDTAVVTSAYLARGIDSEQQFAQRGRFVDVWVKLKGKWLCVSSQDTFIEQ